MRPIRRRDFVILICLMPWVFGVGFGIVQMICYLANGNEAIANAARFYFLGFIPGDIISVIIILRVFRGEENRVIKLYLITILISLSIAIGVFITFAAMLSNWH